MAVGSGMALVGLWSWAGDAAADAAHTADAGTVRLVIFDDQGQRVGEREMATVVKSAAEWKQQLSPLAYKVIRQGGTESPFSGDYSKPDRPGFYRCICCDNALYDAATQFHSGTGCPSFWQPIAEENVTEHPDTTLGMRRTEITCSRCAGHHRNHLQPLRRPSRSCLQRRPATHGAALLHGLGGAALRRHW